MSLNNFPRSFVKDKIYASEINAKLLLSAGFQTNNAQINRLLVTGETIKFGLA
jgi:hypothetical protein